MLPTLSSPLHVGENILRLQPYRQGRPACDAPDEGGTPGVVNLAYNENPLGPSPAAVDAIRRACSQVRTYPDDYCHVLRRSLSTDLEIPADWLILGNGSGEIIHNLGLTFLSPGVETVQGDPTFSHYESVATLANASCIKVPLRDHVHDLDAMEEAFSLRTRLVFIANPNNPTGTINGANQLEKLLDRLPAQAVVVLDEAYHEYVEDRSYPDCRRFVGEGRNVVVLRTFSKAHALAGLRVGYAYAPPHIIRLLDQVRETFNVNAIAQAAAVASLADPGQVERSRAANRQGMAYLTESFTALGLQYIPSSANFVMVSPGRPAGPVCAALERRGILVRSGAPWGMGTFIRVSVGTLSQCERFVQALAEVLLTSL